MKNAVEKMLRKAERDLEACEEDIVRATARMRRNMDYIDEYVAEGLHGQTVAATVAKELDEKLTERTRLAQFIAELEFHLKEDEEN